MKKVLFSLSLILYFVNTNAQLHNDNEHDHHGHSHNLSWELGFGLGAVPLTHENKIAPGLHLHLLRQLEKLKKLQVGLGYENVFDEHTHLNIGAVFNYNLIAGLYTAIIPGVLFKKEEGNWENAFSIHFETTYVFNIGKVHLGPVLDYSYSEIDQHFMLGIHVGFGI